MVRFTVNNTSVQCVLCNVFLWSNGELKHVVGVWINNIDNNRYNSNRVGDNIFQSAFERMDKKIPE